MSSWVIFQGVTAKPETVVENAESVFQAHNRSVESEEPTRLGVSSYPSGDTAHSADEGRLRFVTSGSRIRNDADESTPTRPRDVLDEVITDGQLGELDWGVVIAANDTTNSGSGRVYDGTQLVDTVSGQENRLGYDVAAIIEYYHGLSVEPVPSGHFWSWSHVYRPENDIESHEPEVRPLRDDLPRLEPQPVWTVVVTETPTGDPGERIEALFEERTDPCPRVDPDRNGDRRARFEFTDPVLTGSGDPPAFDLPVTRYLDQYDSWATEDVTAVVVTQYDKARGEPADSDTQPPVLADIYEGGKQADFAAVDADETDVDPMSAITERIEATCGLTLDPAGLSDI